ncbi:ATP-binding protein [Selenomonas sp. TAMA-11512]|uniref:ATP-binding protein n=1 Tax=Selenomonas sp. TAMA-11512 TaxID=3095337 RepID=UPI00308E5061|nr:ATP-binding protein [Selenomonas sp. TAMA-11512]
MEITAGTLQELLIARPLLNTSVYQTLLRYLEEKNDRDGYALSSLLLEQAETYGIHGNVLAGYLACELIANRNLVNHTLEQNQGELGSNLFVAFRHDFDVLAPLFASPIPFPIPQYGSLSSYQPTKAQKNTVLHDFLALLKEAEKTPSNLSDLFLAFYRRFGYGSLALHSAFTWDAENNALLGIKHFETQTLNDIIGYDRQKAQLVDNTLAFLSGKPANNVLLIGARGTGKSSSIKALVSEYHDRGLRLIQLTKMQLVELPHILEYLRSFPSKRFLLFFDDLSFEPFEVEYKYLKSAMEGGVSSKPENVLICATSNRRHLVKETWHDRDEGQDELFKADSMNETISLSDRFGLIITFLAPDQAQYHAIIRHYLDKEGIQLDSEDLRILAQRWELEHSGRSGRTAQQFVQHYLGQIHGNV